MVINLDPHFMKGSHWVALYFDSYGAAEYFDSYGRKPGTRLVQNYVKKYAIDWSHNTKMLQSPYSSTCGEYCIYYLYYKCRGRSLNHILNDFSDDFQSNDVKVKTWLNSKFELNSIPLDPSLWVFQCCKPLQCE